MNINKGYISTEDRSYVKFVNFNKAVLWKTRELSIPLDVLESIKTNKIEQLHFVDKVKKETWTFDIKDIISKGVVKKVGQEPQLYFPIQLQKIKF